MIEPDQEWEVVQTLDTITPGNPHYSEKSRWAKTVRRGRRDLGRRFRRTNRSSRMPTAA